MNHMKAVLKYERTEFGKTIRKKYESREVKLSRNEMRKVVPRTDNIANTLTRVTKDNYLYEDFTDQGEHEEGISGML